MIDQMFTFIEYIDDMFWMYGGTTAIMLLGTYFSIKSGFFQVREFPLIVKNFLGYLQATGVAHQGIMPARVFFAALGSCVGIGNLVGVCMALKMGGPGAVFWMWVTALLGCLVKYGEIYLGMKFRIKSGTSYNGGPIVYLQHIPGYAWLAGVVATLLCVYGVEVFMFKVITHTLVVGWNLPELPVVGFLLLALFVAGREGVRFVGKFSSIVIPFFLVVYLSLSFIVFIKNITVLPGVVLSIFMHAFNPSAVIGGVAGTSLIYVISYGIRRACYISDLGIGYASMIHCESAEQNPARQASTAIIEMFLDTFILATTSMLLVLVTGVWQSQIDVAYMVPTAIATVFPFFMYIWPLIIFLLGYATMSAFFSVGMKAALYLFPQYGKTLYFVYAGCMFLFFSFFAENTHAMGLMSIAGILLLIFNMFGIFKLHHHIKFTLQE
jgi:AGCS family alanine or glycine:cation symporter